MCHLLPCSIFISGVSNLASHFIILGEVVNNAGKQRTRNRTRTGRGAHVAQRAPKTKHDIFSPRCVSLYLTLLSPASRPCKFAHSPKMTMANSVAPMGSFELCVKRPCARNGIGNRPIDLCAPFSKWLLISFRGTHICTYIYIIHFAQHTHSHLKAIASLFTSYYANKWECVMLCPRLFLCDQFV